MNELQKPIVGFLLCGLIIGLALGIIYFKRAHAAEGMVIGPLFGAVAGAILERLVASRAK